VPRMIFGTKREKLHINGLHNLSSSPHNIRMIKPRKIRWTRHVAGLEIGNTSICLSVYLSICLSMALQSFVAPWPLFQFLNSVHRRRTPWTGDQPVSRPLQYKHRINADIHCLSWIRSHDPSVRVIEDSSCFRPRGHCDQGIRNTNRHKVLVGKREGWKLIRRRRREDNIQMDQIDKKTGCWAVC
jgi:hypothetical protein